MLARGIYDADPQDRSKREWAWLLGISESSVDATLKRAAIKRTAYTEEKEVDSQREAKDWARELGAKIVGLEVDGGYLPYDAAMDIREGTIAIFQPPAKHEIVSNEKQIVKAPPAKPTHYIARGHPKQARRQYEKAPETGINPAGTPNLSTGS